MSALNWLSLNLLSLTSSCLSLTYSLVVIDSLSLKALALRWSTWSALDTLVLVVMDALLIWILLLHFSLFMALSVIWVSLELKILPFSRWRCLLCLFLQAVIHLSLVISFVLHMRDSFKFEDWWLVPGLLLRQVELIRSHRVIFLFFSLSLWWCDVRSFLFVFHLFQLVEQFLFLLAKCLVF